MRLNLITFTILLISTAFFAQAQSGIEDVTSKVNSIYKSDSSRFVFDLTVVPEKFLFAVIQAHDSLEYALRHDKSLKNTPLKNFIANQEESWNATDVVKDEVLPWRKFLFAIQHPDGWVISYLHGGIGSHQHLVYFDTSGNLLSSFVTLINSKIINELIFENRVNQVNSRTFDALVNSQNIRLLEGVVVKNYDIF